MSIVLQYEQYKENKDKL